MELRRLVELNLSGKVERTRIREDLQGLVAAWPDGYDIDAAAELVAADVLSLIQ